MKIETIDNEIEDYDLTIDKFWDEIFLIIDWNEEYHINDKTIAELQKPLVAKYIDSLRNGFSIHLLRGRPLKLKSRFLLKIITITVFLLSIKKFVFLSLFLAKLINKKIRISRET